MTKRDFFRIILKLFGLYALILTVFSYIPQHIGYVVIDFNIFVLLWILGVTIFVALIYIFLILKADWIIDLLKIDRGFDDEHIELGNFNNSAIIKFALILIGGFLIIDQVPNFLQYCFMAFKEQVSVKGVGSFDYFAFGKPIDYFNWVISGMNIILGYLLITNYKSLSNWLTRKG
jgi:uncharacterized protein with PQ loop repeat